MKIQNKTELSEEELEKVNKIIAGIQSDLNHAIEKLKVGDFEGALKSINEGVTKSNCPLCKRELGILIADIVHNKEICILKSDTCKDEQELIIDKAIELKDDFIPITQTKKALKDKKAANKNITTLEISPSFFPIPPTKIFSIPPHEMITKLFQHKN